MEKNIRNGCLGFILLGVLLFLFVSLEKNTRVDLQKLVPPKTSLITDRFGKTLRWIRDDQGERHIWKPLASISDNVEKAFVAAEDQRFYKHFGVDIAAIFRASIDNVKHGRIVSGASTITQQVARMVNPRDRSFSQKFLEAVRSIRIEGTLEKRKILELYLNYVPMGNNLVGVEAASRVYFGKPSSRLTLHEAAVLASLPKAPGFMNPYGKNIKRLLSRKDWVLDRMLALEFISREEFNLSKRLSIQFKKKHIPFEAPHFVNHLIANNSTNRRLQTTLDLGMQNRLEKILLSHRERLQLKGAKQAAVVVLDNKTSQIRALLGSIKYSKVSLGYNNGATALRSPGSTLKPFLFAQALDSGINTSTVLEDIERKYPSPNGVYSPANFNRKSYGPVSIRTALGNSLNQTAVSLLNKVGYSSFYKTLQSLDLINFPERGPDYYGLGMVVGNPEVTLLQLASAYATLARGGKLKAPKYLASDKPEEGVRVFSEEASYILTDILSDPSARSITFGDFFNHKLPFKLAIKTGTSTHYRDAWIVGYTLEHTIAVWVGNFNGIPTMGMSGALAAGPILVDILNSIYSGSSSSPFKKPVGVISKKVCSYSGMTPGKFCPHTKKELFIAGSEPTGVCNYHKNPTGTHDLSPRYATWLHDKYKRGAEGSYRLAGFPSDLSKVFGEGSPISMDISRTYDQPQTIQITKPVNGETYILNPNESAYEIVLDASSRLPMHEITWYIDGREHETVGPPYKTTWTLSRGRHTITAAGSNHSGDSIDIDIR